MVLTIHASPMPRVAHNETHVHRRALMRPVHRTKHRKSSRSPALNAHFGRAKWLGVVYRRTQRIQAQRPDSQQGRSTKILFFALVPGIDDPNTP